MDAIGKAATWLIALFLCLESTESSRAQILAPKPIEAPLPENWRAPFAQYLRDLGTPAVDELLGATRTAELLPANTLIIRIEHASACEKLLCMTLIAELKTEAIGQAAMFFAGKWFTQADTFPSLLKTSFAPPLLFFTTVPPTLENKPVLAVSTPRGWIFVGGARD